MNKKTDRDVNYLIISNRKCFFVINLEDLNDINVLKGFPHESIMMIDDRYFYAMMNKCDKRDSGLYFMTLDNFLYEDEDDNPENDGDGVKCFKLKSAVGHKSNFMSYMKLQ